MCGHITARATPAPPLATHMTHGTSNLLYQSPLYLYHIKIHYHAHRVLQAGAQTRYDARQRRLRHRRRSTLRLSFRPVRMGHRRYLHESVPQAGRTRRDVRITVSITGPEPPANDFFPINIDRLPSDVKNTAHRMSEYIKNYIAIAT